MEYNTGESKKLTEKEVFLVRPYRDSLIYLEAVKKKNSEYTKFYRFSIVKLGGQDDNAFYTDKYVYNFKIRNDWVYYIDGDYNMNRFSLTDLSEQQVIENSGMYAFEILEDKIVCVRDYDVVVTNLDGTDSKTIISTPSANILDMDNESVVLKTKNYLMFYNTKSQETTSLSGYSSCQLVNDVLYVETMQSGAFCSLNGDILYQVFY